MFLGLAPTHPYSGNTTEAAIPQGPDWQDVVDAGSALLDAEDSHSGSISRWCDTLAYSARLPIGMYVTLGQLLVCWPLHMLL